MRMIDADEIFYDQLLNIGHKEHPLEFAVSKKRIDDMPTITKVWVPDSCRNCNNHPVNGGSGICNCILGGIQWT